jgi:hypothetical protein
MASASSEKTTIIRTERGYCDANRCREEPDRIVREFLDILSQE